MEMISVTLPDPTPQQGGATAVLNLPVGLTYHSIDVAYSGVTLAQMESIVLKVDGQIVKQYGSGEDVDAMNQFDGKAAAAGILTIDFERVGLMTPENRVRSVLGTHYKTADGKGARAIKTAQLEIKIASGVVAPVLSATAEQSPPREMDVMCRLLEFTYDLASGENHIANLPFGNLQNAYINRIFIETANTTKMVMRKNQRTIFERTKAHNELKQTDGKRTPQTGLVVIDTTEQGFGGNLINTLDAQDLRLLLTASGAETATVRVEYHGVK